MGIGIQQLCSLIALVWASIAMPVHAGDGFVWLLDEESLAGWHVLQRPEGDKFHATNENFFVRDGVLHCFQLDNKHGGMLLTDREYDQFELAMDLKIDWGCDCGILLHCNDDGACIQILNDFLKNGCIGFPFGERTGSYISQPILLNLAGDDVRAEDSYNAVEKDGLVYAIDAAGWNRAWRQEDWNAIRIRCEGAGPSITTWINGVKIMEMDGEIYRGRSLDDYLTRNWDAPSAWDKAKVHKITGGRGAIGFQLHPGRRWKPGGFARYRRIQIRELGQTN
ncbi:3-keto-disaccharide hydrolase [Aporhodopirellula rubra]|uniref:3-keto-disaccharide hydrolase n=1 Tax=Aporhodopirellula rubra TaxID=980271 RepID=UPI0016191A9C|nr:DUF1080 domain-containing protein [Aporhodopirellula rubra]